MDNTKRDFNSAAHFFLGLSMFATVMTIINSFLKIDLFGSSNSLIIEIVIDFLILVAAVFTFMKKRYGLVALLALFIIRLFATIPSSTNISTASYLGAHTATLIRDIGLFVVAMFFKKNGISGWDSMLASEEYVAKHTVLPDTDNQLSNDNELNTIESERPVDESISGKEREDAPEVISSESEIKYVDDSKGLFEEGIDPNSIPREGEGNNKQNQKDVLPANERRIKWGRILLPIALLLAIVEAVLLIQNRRGGMVLNVEGDSYLYMEKSEDSKECVIHRNPKCKENLVYIELSNVYSGDFDESNFCSKCFTPKKLRPILDSCLVYKGRKEISEHISKFYNAFSAKYDNFESEQAFRNWLSNADSTKIKNLYIAFNKKYNNYDGPNGINEMIAYLGWKCPSTRVTTVQSANAPLFSTDVHEDDIIISDEDLIRKQSNLAKVYSILKENKLKGIGKDFDEFSSLMSRVTNRKKVYDYLYKEKYELGSFDEFEEKLYPATDEHLEKERNRRWLYRKLKEEGVIVGDYESFCSLLCYDEDLRSFYDQGTKAGLNLGSYEVYRKNIL